MLGLTLYNMEQFRNCWPADVMESVFGTKIKKKQNVREIRWVASPLA